MLIKFKHLYVLPALIMSSVLMNQCGKKTDSSFSIDNIDVPDIRPKILSATPNSLSKLNLNLLEEQVNNPGASMASRLFSPGPTYILQILADVDTGMASIEKRVNEESTGPDEEGGSYAPCLGNIEEGEFALREPIAFPINFDFDIDGKDDLKTGFISYLHCYDDLTRGDGSAAPSASDENLETKYWRGFGVSGTGDSEYWYIVEGADPAAGGRVSQGASAIKVSKKKDDVEMWFRVGTPGSNGEGGSGVLAHLRRDPSGTIEYTHTGKGVGYGCGMHTIFSKESELAYFKVKTDQETNGEGGVDCSDYIEDSSNASKINKEYCIDMSSSSFVVEPDLSRCTAAGLTKSSLTMDGLDYTVVSYQEAANSFLASPPKGIKLLYKEDISEE